MEYAWLNILMLIEADDSVTWAIFQFRIIRVPLRKVGVKVKKLEFLGKTGSGWFREGSLRTFIFDTNLLFYIDESSYTATSSNRRFFQGSTLSQEKSASNHVQAKFQIHSQQLTHNNQTLFKASSQFFET